jgi:type I restriction enzyme S subunit
MKVRLGDIFQVTSGGTPNRQKLEYFSNGTIPWVKTGELKGKYASKPAEYLSEAGIENSSAKIFPKGTVLLAMYGATIGACSILEFDAATNQACAALLPSKGCTPDYMYYYLTSIKNELVRRGVGGAQPNISAGIIKDLIIPVPPIPIQQKIASILDAADALRQKDRLLLKKYEELQIATLFKFLGNSIGIEKRTIIPESNEHLPKGFKWKRLRDICIEIADIDHKMPKGFPSGKMFLSAKDLSDDGELDFSDPKFISEEDFAQLSRKIKPRKNDIIYSRIGAKLGKARLVKTNDDFLVSYSCCTIRPEPALVSSLYLRYYLDSSETLKQATHGTKSIGVPDLGMNEIRNFMIPVPDSVTTESIDIALTLVEAQKISTASAASKSEELFNSLLQKAFSGELVREGAAGPRIAVQL